MRQSNDKFRLKLHNSLEHETTEIRRTDLRNADSLFEFALGRHTHFFLSIWRSRRKDFVLFYFIPKNLAFVCVCVCLFFLCRKYARTRVHQTFKRFLGKFNQTTIRNQWKIYTTLHIFDSFQEIEQTEVQSNIRNIRCVSDPSLLQPKWRVVFALVCLLTFLLVFYFIFAADIVVVFAQHSSEERRTKRTA